MSKRRLIEDWLPIAALSAECECERDPHFLPPPPLFPLLFVFPPSPFGGGRSRVPPHLVAGTPARFSFPVRVGGLRGPGDRSGVLAGARRGGAGWGRLRIYLRAFSIFSPFPAEWRLRS